MGSTSPAACQEKRDTVIRKIRTQYFSQCQFKGALRERRFCSVPAILLRVPSGHTQPQKTRPKKTVAIITATARKKA